MRTLSNIEYNEHRQHLNVHLPDGEPTAIFIYFHGGGLESGAKDPSAPYVPYLTQHNIALVDIDYRLYPDAKYPEFIEDAADAVAWTFAHKAEFAGDVPVFAGGTSAGGYISMMLCFNDQYLGKHGILPTDLAGFIHDAGQPTSHFNVLRERGVDTRRLIVDESAPLYYIGANGNTCTDMLFLVSDGDIENRYEQTMLVLSTLRHFRYDPTKIQCICMHGSHCQYVFENYENGDSIFGQIITRFIYSVIGKQNN